MNATRVLNILASTLGLAFSSLPAGAQGEDPTIGLHLSGFATFGATAIDHNDLWLYRSGVNKPGKARIDFGSDTLAGVQGSLRLGKAGDLTVQAMTHESSLGSYAPRITWAFWRFSPSPTLSMRIGRLRAPFFMLSDSLYVNYSHPWVRPPQEVYGLNPFNDLDGFDLLWQVPLGKIDLEIKPYYGNGRIDLLDEGKARLRQIGGLNLTLVGERFSLHAGHGQGRLRLNWNDPLYLQLAGMLNLAGAPATALSAKLSGKQGHTSFTSAGFQWDDGLNMLTGEFVYRRADRYVNSAHAWHLTAGRRFGAFTPYLTLARQRQKRPVAESSVLSPQLAAALKAFAASRNGAQRSLTIGARWDFARDTALKMEWSRAHVDRGAWGVYFPNSNLLTSTPDGRTVHMLSLSLDVVF